MKIDPDKITTDTFFRGRIQVMQYRLGYRFSIDAVILSHNVNPRPNDKIIDLGTGSGIIPIMMVYRNPKIDVCGIEIQRDLADLALYNIKQNRMDDKITILCDDMKSVKIDRSTFSPDWVVCNPPYSKANSGRINPNRQKAIARHEIKINLSDVINTAKSMLQLAGKFMIIYPAKRMVDLITKMRLAGIEPKFIRMIHSRKDTEAKLILVKGKKGGRFGVKIGAPLNVYKSDGSYTDEMKEMFTA